MQNQKNYQEFIEQSQIPRGIPVGQPVQYNVPVQQLPQAPYFQQPNNNMYQNYPQQAQMNVYPPQNQPPMVLQPHSSKMYNNSINVRCSCCKQTVQTIVNNQSGNNAYIWGALICCFVGQCCCLPFMFDDCLDKAHYCPNCGQTIMRKHAKCFDIIN